MHVAAFRKGIIITSCLFFVGCSGPSALNYLEKVDTDAIQNTVEQTLDTVQKEAGEFIQATEEGLAQPVNATEGTGRHVKEREQLMEEAGGKMIDEMR